MGPRTSVLIPAARQGLVTIVNPMSSKPNLQFSTYVHTKDDQHIRETSIGWTYKARVNWTLQCPSIRPTTTETNN